MLIAYATNSSGTLVVAGLIKDLLTASNVDAVKKDIRSVKPEAISEFDLVILGSPSWNYNDKEGQPHEFFTKFFQQNDGKVRFKNTAVFGLGDSAYIQFCGAVDYLESFVLQNNGKLTVPSLRIDGFFFNQKENEELIGEWVKNIMLSLTQTQTNAKSLHTTASMSRD